MKKTTTTLLFLVISLLPIYSIAEYTPTDEEKIYDLQQLIKVNKNKVSYTDTLVELNRELQKEIWEHRAREDYLAVALEDQASRFSTIITIFFALIMATLGLFPLTLWPNEKKKILNRIKVLVNEKFDITEDELKKLVVDTKQLKKETSLSYANHFYTTAQSNLKIKHYAASINQFLVSAHSHAEYDLMNNKEKNDFEWVIKSFEKINKAITELEKPENESKLDALKEKKKTIIKSLDAINKMKTNEEIILTIANIRVAIEKFTTE